MNPRGTPQNLTAPRWRKGQSGNPKGRPSGALYISDYLNELGECTEERVEAVLADATQPVNRRIAAKQLLLALHRGGRHFDRVCDRTSGKPHQAIVFTTPEPERPLMERLVELRERYDQTVIP